MIEVRNLSNRYEGIQLLREVEFSLARGEILCLLGPSGSGKTTLLNLIGGLDVPSRGTIILDNDPITDLSQSQLADIRLNKIGFVFQAYNIIPVLSARENVEYVMLMQGVPAKQRRQRAKAALNDVGLSGMHDRRPAELSGGQQQRVAVARALVSNPAIILADEPTANLDSHTGRGLLEMMARMNEQRKVTFIFSTHDQMVMGFSRRIIRLTDGKVADDLQK